MRLFLAAHRIERHFFHYPQVSFDLVVLLLVQLHAVHLVIHDTVVEPYRTTHAHAPLRTQLHEQVEWQLAIRPNFYWLTRQVIGREPEGCKLCSVGGLFKKRPSQGF